MRHILAMSLLLAFCCSSVAADPAPAGRWIDPRCTPLDLPKVGPFVADPNGNLLTIDKNVLRTSADRGKTWSDPGLPVVDGMDIGPNGHVGQFLRTEKGVLVAAYLDMSKYVFAWDNEKQAPKPESILELWTVRSEDGGKTWTDKQRLLDGYNADFMGFIQIRGGRLVLTVEHLVPELRRWVTLSFISDDEGKTWKQSNWIDLGGLGHHDGAVEPCVVELTDGRLMMLIRTNLDKFWSAYSDDQGRYWRTIQPTTLNASSAPGWVLRLKSGRIMFTWNQLNPTGKTANRTIGGGPTSEFPASWHREELSIAFSDDDGKSWSEPIVVARDPGAQIAYPYIFEPSPGEIWLFTYYTFDAAGKPAPPLALRLNEKDFPSAK